MIIRTILPRKNYRYRQERGRRRMLNIDGVEMTIEQYEMLMLKMATLKLHPSMPSDMKVAKILGTTSATIKKIRKNPRYAEIVDSMMAEVRAQWKGDIQAVIINRAMKGSPAHIDFFFNLDKEFNNKRNGANVRDDIPADREEKKKLIAKLIAETEDKSLDSDKKAPEKSVESPEKSKLRNAKTVLMEIDG